VGCQGLFGTHSSLQATDREVVTPGRFQQLINVGTFSTFDGEKKRETGKAVSAPSLSPD
jgi:hypothetical protein